MKQRFKIIRQEIGNKIKKQKSNNYQITMKRNLEVRSYNDLLAVFMSGKHTQAEQVPAPSGEATIQAGSATQDVEIEERSDAASTSTEYNQTDENCILEQMAEHSDVAIKRLENYWRVNHKLKGTAMRPRSLFAFLNHAQDIVTYSRFYEHINPECIWLRAFDFHMNHKTKYVHPQGYIYAVASNIVQLDELVSEFEAFARECLESH